MTRLMVLCDKRELHALLDTYGDWEAEILLYGVTRKAKDGFILMQWTKPIPENFIQRQLHEDDSVLDFFTDDTSDQSNRVPV